MLNGGWWGMAVHANTTYKGSFYAKADSADLGPLTVSLVSDDTGKAVATTTVNGLGTDWKQYTFALKTGAVEASAANHLEITAWTIRARCGCNWCRSFPRRITTAPTATAST